MPANPSKPPFEAVEPPVRLKLSDSIVSQIEQLILEGTLKPGDALPAERDFSEQLQVSRPSLREALLKLEARGLVSARRGGGYSVADVTATTLTDPLVHLLQRLRRQRTTSWNCATALRRSPPTWPRHAPTSMIAK